jgi:heme exporter protein C
MAFSDFANPSRFLRFANQIIPWLGGVTVLAFAFGIDQAMMSPDDYRQGAAVKIMYIHVPSAWLGMLCWGLMAVAALGTLVWRHPLADVAAKTAAPIGAAFTLLCLITGSLWGRPMWGTYWVWDGRLTSMLVLFLMYLGLITLWRSVDDTGRAGRLAAILTLVGTINLPVIKFSVECWNTLHQPASFLRFSPATISRICKLMGGTSNPSITDVAALQNGPAVYASFLVPLRNELLRRRVRTLHLMQASAVS